MYNKNEMDQTLLNKSLEEIENELHDLSKEIIQVEPELQEATELAETTAEELNVADEALQNWQSRWDAFNQQHSKTMQVAEVEQTRITHLC